MTKVLEVFKEKIPESNLRIIEGLRNEDEVVINEIYDKYVGLVKGYILKRGGSIDDVKDIFQESLITVISNVQRTDFNIRTNFKSYFMGIVSNKWVKRFRYLTRSANFNDDEAFSNAIGQYEVVSNLFEDFLEKESKTELLNKLSKSFKAMKENCQKVIALFYFQGLSHIQLAEVMNYSEKYSRLKMHRCMDKLKEMMLK